MTSRPLTGTCVVKAALVWIPVLLPPFLALLAEITMHLDVFISDYRMTTLSNQIYTLQQEIKELRAQEANLEGMQRLETMAMELGLVTPAHDQIVLVQAPVESVMEPPPLAFAQLNVSHQTPNATRMSQGDGSP